jgi:maltoporin
MQRNRGTRPVLRLTAAAALAFCAADAAHAVDWSGYFRGGPAITNVEGQSRQCFGLSGPGMKYRLGNECDFYGEFQLAQAFKAEGVEYNAVLMTNFYSPATETNKSSNVNDNFGVEQAYVEMKGFDFAPGVLFWMGKRRDRDDVHIVDTFFTNMSGVGAGVEAIPVGSGGMKFGFSGYKSDGNTGSGVDQNQIPANGNARVHVQLYDIGINNGGKLRLVGSYGHADSHGGVTQGEQGWGATVEHVQENFLGLGGGNHMWLQYASGSLDLNQGFGNSTTSTDSDGWRFVESPTWQVGALGGQAIALYQHNSEPGNSSDQYSIGGRVSYAISKNIKWLTELGYAQKNPAHAPSENLTKLTLGPALSTGPDFWKRPELRLYVTWADFNDAAALDPSNGLPADKNSGLSYGAQVEIWF